MENESKQRVGARAGERVAQTNTRTRDAASNTHRTTASQTTDTGTENTAANPLSEADEAAQRLNEQIEAADAFANENRVSRLFARAAMDYEAHERRPQPLEHWRYRSPRDSRLARKGRI